MSSVYVPTAVALGSITCPDDGDTIEAADVNVPIEAIADGVLYSTPRIDAFLVSGTWTCPAGVTSVSVEGFGGGGGGGGGVAGTATSTHKVCGGSGGGGAPRTRRKITVVPTTVYTVTIAAASAGGAAASPGAEGGDCTFGALATFYGAGKGFNPLAADATVRSAAGGTTVRNGTPDDVHTTVAIPFIHRHPGCGGASLSYSGGYGGHRSADGFDGGAGALVGTDNGAYLGGGGGGGGGAGGAGVGGAGGVGGHGWTAAPGDGGAGGSAAAANTGAGGGGGGGGGNGTSGGAGGAGGAGGTGLIIVFYDGPQAVVT